MNLYVRFLNDQPNGVFTCQSFKAHEGDIVTLPLEWSYEQFPELVVEFDNGEVLHNVLDFEAV